MQNPTTLELRRPNPYCIEVWLNRPDVRNAFNETVIAELTEVFQDIARNQQLRVVVLAAHGKAFCAGADLNWMQAMSGYSWDQNRADAQQLADVLFLLKLHWQAVQHCLHYLLLHGRDLQQQLWMQQLNSLFLTMEHR